MPAIPKKKQQTIHLAVWDHKHGLDMSAHTTEKGAFKQCVDWAREALEEWQDDSYKSYTDEDLYSSWGDITGFTEFFRVDTVLLNEDAADEKEEWVADTSHIGA